MSERDFFLYFITKTPEKPADPEKKEPESHYEYPFLNGTNEEIIKKYEHFLEEIDIELTNYDLPAIQRRMRQFDKKALELKLDTLKRRDKQIQLIKKYVPKENLEVYSDGKEDDWLEFNGLLESNRYFFPKLSDGNNLQEVIAKELPSPKEKKYKSADEETKNKIEKYVTEVLNPMLETDTYTAIITNTSYAKFDTDVVLCGVMFYRSSKSLRSQAEGTPIKFFFDTKNADAIGSKKDDQGNFEKFTLVDQIHPFARGVVVQDVKTKNYYISRLSDIDNSLQTIISQSGLMNMAGLDSSIYHMSGHPSFTDDGVYITFSVASSQDKKKESIFIPMRYIENSQSVPKDSKKDIIRIDMSNQELRDIHPIEPLCLYEEKTGKVENSEDRNINIIDVSTGEKKWKISIKDALDIPSSKDKFKIATLQAHFSSFGKGVTIWGVIWLKDSSPRYRIDVKLNDDGTYTVVKKLFEYKRKQNKMIKVELSDIDPNYTKYRPFN